MTFFNWVEVSGKTKKIYFYYTLDRIENFILIKECNLFVDSMLL